MLQETPSLQDDSERLQGGMVERGHGQKRRMAPVRQHSMAEEPHSMDNFCAVDAGLQRERGLEEQRSQQRRLRRLSVSDACLVLTRVAVRVALDVLRQWHQELQRARKMEEAGTQQPVRRREAGNLCKVVHEGVSKKYGPLFPECQS